MTSISHPRRTDDTAMHHHPHGPGRTLEPSSGKAPATNHNHRGYSSQLQQQTSQPYTNQKDMGTTLAGTTQGSSGTSSTLTVLKRGDACLFCRKRKLKCDAGESRSCQWVSSSYSPFVDPRYHLDPPRPPSFTLLLPSASRTNPEFLC
jgi:hypothetical protein